MLPVPAVHDETNHGRGDTVLLGQPALLPTNAGVCRADGDDVCVREFGATVGATPMIPASTLGFPVTVVVTPRSRPEVRWIAARRIVAAVQNARGFLGKLPVGKYVRDTMGKNGSVTFSTATDAKGSVSSVVGATLPRPARIRSIGSIDLRPESINLNWSNMVEHVTSPRDVPRPRLFPAARGLSVLYHHYNRMVTV